MAYSIAYIVLGIDLGNPNPYGGNKPDPFKDFRDEIYNHREGREDESRMYGRTEPTKGFETRYSGSGEQPEWFGIDMSQFDECESLTGPKLIERLTPTDEHRAQYAELLEETRTNSKVSDELKALLERTEPQVLVLWGTS